MSWRLHLSNQAIHRLDILPGKSSLVAAWPQRSRVYFFDLETGTQLGERLIKEPEAASHQDALWQEFLSSLTAPNRAYLPVVRAGRIDIYFSSDGRVRLYYGGKTDLHTEIEGKETALNINSAQDFVTVEMDRFLGLIGALDEQGRLHLFQQQTSVGVFDTGLRISEDVRPALAITHGGTMIFASDGHQIVQFDSNGQVRSRLSAHYLVSRLCCAPNGRWLATGDTETNVIRVYSGPDLAAAYQRHAEDLLAQAAEVQLIADPPPPSAALNALAISGRGDLAFTLAGVICVSSVEKMNRLPRN